ncbi:MAG: restriction endonuclease subunit S [Candidatus Omnitrophica bacterium]|nr:restriction endonuclease subunit S [Candidatus Omnitrophota bacterium]
MKELGDIAKESIVGSTPLKNNPAYWENGIIPWITNKEVEYGKVNYISDTAEKVSKKTIEETNLRIVPTYSLIISFTASVGKVAINKVPLTTNQQFISFVLKDNFNVIYYAYYFVSSKDVIESFSGATPFSFITKERALSIPIPYPPLPEQSRIATILSYFDDLIENKKRQNEILEKTAMAIFKNWFVDFEPFKDGEFVDSELGKIPNGWEVKRIGELLENIFAGEWGDDERSEKFYEAAYCIRGTDIAELNKKTFIDLPLRFIKKETIKNKRLKENDIVIEISGGSFDQQTGRVLLVSSKLLDSYDLPLISSNFCRVIRSKYPLFLYFLFQYFYTINLFYEYESGTTSIKNLDIKSILNLLILFPPPPILQKFHSLVEPLFQKIINNQKQIMVLKKIRDTILPLLVFGKLRVEEL